MGEALDFNSMFEPMPEDERHSGPPRETFTLAREVVQVGTLDLEAVRPRFEDFKREAGEIAAEAGEVVVQDPASLQLAVAIGGRAKRIGKAIEAQRKALILEPAEFVKGVNALCKMIVDNLDEAERVTKSKIGQHQAKIELERREAERKAKEATEALQRKLQAETDEANRKAAAEARRRVEEEQRFKQGIEEAKARERGAKKAELEALARAAEIERQTAVKQAEEEAAKIAVIAPTVVAPVVQEAPRVTRTEAGSASQRKVWTYDIFDAALVPREYLLVSDAKVRDAVKMGVRSIPGVRIFEETKTVFRT